MQTSAFPLHRVLGPLLLVVTTATIYAPLFGPEELYFRDLIRTDIPMRAFIGAALAAGRLPEWFPWDGLGIQFIGNAEGLFRPQSVLSVFLAPFLAIKVEILLTTLWGGVGFAVFARRLGLRPEAAWGGAVAFCFSGYGLSLHTNLPYFTPFHTVPWLLAAAHLALTAPDRTRRLRGVGLLALAWAFIILAGDPLLAIGAGLLLLGLVAMLGAWRSAPWLLLSTPLTSLLVMIWVLPAYSLYLESIRRGWTPNGKRFALHLARIPELLLGGGAPSVEPMLTLRAQLDGDLYVWAYSLVLGGAVVGLAGLAALTAPRSWVWLLIAGTATWLSLGTAGGFHPIAIRVFPLLASFRFPEKFMALTSIAMVVAAAVGLDRAFGAPARTRWLVLAAVSGLALAGILSTFTLEGDGSAPGELRGQWVRGAVVALLALGASLWLAGGAGTAGLRSWAVPVVLASELVVAGKDLVWTVPSDFLAGEPRWCRLAADLGVGTGRLRASNMVDGQHRWQAPADGQFWVAGLLNHLEPDSAALCDIESMSTPNLSGVPRRLWRVINELPYPRVARLFNVGVIIVDGDSPVPGVEVVARGEKVAMVKPMGTVLPRAFAAVPRWVPTDEAALRAVAELEVTSFERHAILEGEFFSEDDGLPPGSVTVNAYEPGRVELSVDLPAERAVVLNDLYAPGWTATVDGGPVPIHRTNYLVRGVMVPAGSHTLVFTFTTPGLGLGAILAAVGLLVVAALVLPRDRLPRRGGAPARRALPDVAATSR